MAEYNKEEIKNIEKKWQKKWVDDKVYKVSNDPDSYRDRPKYYVLDMFPYPSGAGLHVGHPLGYIASDIVSRYKRIKGFNVLHPMGFDAFGLPAEQYAIQTGQHPEKTTRVNIDTYKRQLNQIGFSFDWEREVRTSDASYYKWTQWIFMQLFNAWYNKDGVGDDVQKTFDNSKKMIIDGHWPEDDKRWTKIGGPKSPSDSDDVLPLNDNEYTIRGLTEPIATLIAELERNGNKNVNAVADENTPFITAEQWKKFNEAEREHFLQNYRIAYRSDTMVNWCAALGTVLSNDEVKDGVSERGGYPVERKKMWQWSMRISAYAERLLNGLDTIDWPEPLKEMQRNWIGKSTGCELSFNIEDSTFNIDVFTTRIDTIYGVTFMVLAPEHELVGKITTAEQKSEVENYVSIAKNRSERERMTEVKRISGAFTGAYAINPFNNEKIPVWIADYVLAGYGTGAVMAVPSSDTRDYAFAKHFNLPIIPVLEGSLSDITKDNFEPKSGKIINSDDLNGLDWKDAIEKALQKVESSGIGKRKINYRMRDAIFGRQRYWGEPFPVYFENGIPKLVDLKDLPVTLPEIDAYKPTESGEPPLGRAKDWNYKGNPYELTTMPGWAGSSWYWFRYMDPKNDKEFVSKEAESYWQDVDLYIGGSEHATGHLLYSRFWCKALKDLGYVHAEEPFKKLINQGHIQGVSQFITEIRIHSSIKSLYDGKELILCVLENDKIIKELKVKIEQWHHQYLSYDSKSITCKYKDPSTNVFIKTDYNPSHAKIEFVENNILNPERWTSAENYKPILFTDKGYWHWNSKSWKNYNDQEISENIAFTTRPEVEKMSKSKLNVVNPDDIVNIYGADTLRMYEMFLGPLEQSKPWNTQGIDGVYKFLRRFWNLSHDAQGNFNVSDAEPTRDELKILHKALKKVEADIENFSFNTSVSEFMICTNELSALKCNKRTIIEPLVIALSPFAPHIAEELWSLLGHKDTILKATFRSFDEQYLKESSFKYPISINGKVRAEMNFALDMPKEDIEKVVLASEIVLKWTEGKPPKKVIVVPGRIVNVVL